MGRLSYSGGLWPKYDSPYIVDMKVEGSTPAEYIANCPEERQPILKKIRSGIRKHLPKGFKEGMGYGMIAYVVPHSKYPDGYHCDPKLPLPFINLASQKNFIALYHFGIYADEKLMNWFTEEYPKHCKRTLNMGKSCIRFKYMDDIPYDLINDLCSKISPDQWIETYEKAIKNK